MGVLDYGGRRYDLPDRTLAHLQFVIITKLRRRESFGLSWMVPVELGSGRHVLWIDNGVPIRITYDNPRMGRVNPKWIEAMLEGAYSPTGLTLMDEPTPSDVHTAG